MASSSLVPGVEASGLGFMVPDGETRGWGGVLWSLRPFGILRRIHICFALDVASLLLNFDASITCVAVSWGAMVHSFTACRTRGSVGDLAGFMVRMVRSVSAQVVAMKMNANEQNCGLTQVLCAM